MNIIHEKPPVYNLYRSAFGSAVNWEKGIIIAYDNAIYSSITPSQDEIEHEKVHLRQQNDIGLDIWVQRYIHDAKFRLDMETEAYVRQVNYLRESGAPRRERIFKVKMFAKFLSGSMYGNLISFSDALNLLK